jgi:mono/diheme cytochrome c family protein
MQPWVKRLLKVFGWVVAILVAAILGVVIYINASWDSAYDYPVSSRTASMDSATIAHGEFLFKYSANCWMCHSPNRQVDELPSGGVVEDLREVGPGFGIFYVKNITPDVETGIGRWTDGEIVRAVREGIGKDGHAFFIMPSRAFNKMSDDDAFAIAAYLKSLPPVKNPLPPHEYSFMTKALYAFGLIAPQPPVTEVIPTPAKEVSLERGKYLANHTTTCSDCHSPIDLNTGQFFADSLFVGGNFAISEPFGKVPEETINPIWAYGRNLTPDDETGIGKMTEEEFVTVMRSGMRPDSTVLVATEMPYPYFKLWDDDDLRAIYAYFKSMAPVHRTVPPKINYSKDATQGSGIPRGKALFTAYCRPCHGERGNGAPATKTKLAELAPSLDDNDLKEFIAEGQLNLWMPPFKKTFSPEELDDVVAFIRSWENNQ